MRDELAYLDALKFDTSIGFDDVEAMVCCTKKRTLGRSRKQLRGGLSQDRLMCGGYLSGIWAPCG